MTRTRNRHLRQSIKASIIALYLLVNVAGIVLVAQDRTDSEIAGHLCVGHLSLMTDVTPDIHC